MKISGAALVTFLAASTCQTSAFVPTFGRPCGIKCNLKPDANAILTEDDKLVVSSGETTTTISGTKIVTSVPEPKSLLSARESVASNLRKYVGQSGASIVYSKLVEHGVSVVNGYSGGAILPLLDQFHPDHPRHEAPPIRWITNSNEASAGHVAEGYAKAGGKTGVVVCTSGPGVTNLITPMQDAICDGVGMVVLAGQTATTAPKDAFQQAPAVALTTPCSKWSYAVRSAAELPLVMDYAFFIAQSGRPGPVFVDLPKDLQNQVVDSDILDDFVNGIGLKGSKKDGFIRFVEDHNHALHIGMEDEGILFKIGEQGLEQMTNFDLGGKEGLYQDDHHAANTIYKSNHDDSMSNYRRTSPLSLDSSLTKEILETISQAKRPIIVAGQGCNECPAELLQFAERFQIPVATTVHALGCFDERHSLALNMVGMHGHPTPNYMIQESDLLICIGSRFDDRITGLMSAFAPEAKSAGKENRGGIIHVDIRLSENAKQVKPTFFVHSAARTFLETLNALDIPQVTDKSPWLRRKADLEFDFPVKIPSFPTEEVKIDGKTVSKTPLSAQSVVALLNSELLAADRMDDTVISTGVGIHQMVAAQLFTWTRPRQMITSGSLGTMGVALGFVIGCKLNNGSMTCIAVDGDGSFNMTFTELKTVAEQKIPVKILILDNESQMMVEYWQKLFHDERYLAVTNNKNPNYCTLADSFGIKNLYADSEEDLPEVIREFLFEDPEEPVLMHVKIQKTPCLPLVAPGKPLQEMILEDVIYKGLDPNAAPG